MRAFFDIIKWPNKLFLGEQSECGHASHANMVVLLAIAADRTRTYMAFVSLLIEGLYSVPCRAAPPWSTV